MKAASVKKVTIIGLGLIGGSVGMALRSAGLRDLQVAGYSRSAATRSRSVARGAVDETARSLAGAVEGAGLVILAIPVMSMESVLKELGDVLAPGSVVTDVASTKTAVLRWAAEALPDRVFFVGGHPMAGKEASGIDAADPGLFRGCTYCICPAPGASAAAVETVVSLANVLGARPYFLDPKEHDSFVAGISHLPMLLSTALVSATAGSAAWREMSRLASSGYRDTTRLASSDPIMSRDIYLTNRESLSRWADALIAELERLRREINGDGSELEASLRRVKEARDRWQQGGPVEEREQPPEVPEGGWGHLLLGNLLSSPVRRTRKNG